MGAGSNLGSEIRIISNFQMFISHTRPESRQIEEIFYKIKSQLVPRFYSIDAHIGNAIAQISKAKANTVDIHIPWTFGS